MHNQLLPIGLAVAVGIGIGALLVTRPASEQASIDGSSQNTMASFVAQVASGDFSQSDPELVARALDSLAHVLDEEIVERRILAEQLEELSGQFTDLQDNLGTRVTEAFAARTNESSVDRTPQQATPEARLAAAGFTQQQVATLGRRRAEAQMQQVELDDRARREGWVNTPRYYQELNAFSNDLDPIRQDLGDEAYERYLFAIGRPNRVTVGGVIETSPAEQSGLRAGDVIRSYAGERIFSNQQLTNLRSGGDSGAPVSVEVIREGVPLQITIPRGPMGIQIQMEVIDPTAQAGG